ncbi:MAG: DUF429 domain-containing protein [Myxococcota bacterium]
MNRPDRPASVLGVDLTADEGRTCAAAILRWDSKWILEAPERPLDSDCAIVELAGALDVVALDGPRRPPAGFVGFVARGETPPEGAARSRACEREHVRRICPIFYSSPVASAGVQRWMKRSWALFEALEHRPIEIYPMGGFVASLNGVSKRAPHGLPSKGSRAGHAARIAIVEQVLDSDVSKFIGAPQGNEKAHDRADAIMAAITAAAHRLGQTVSLGELNDGMIVVPDLRR